ncbi:hypothetical protein [Polaribacter sp. Asnod1-A03]|uniref:hypothetical protein n=1 Tax=Polaribacter sp. Asnod1-A03 TaxID=3160581 RepID=UPI00386DD729
MKSFLEFLGLIKKINLTIEIEKSEFIKCLKQKVKPNGLIFLDVLDNDRKEFYGNVNSEKFWLRKSRQLFSESTFASACGVMKDSKNKTSLKIKIIGWNWFIIVWTLVMSFVLWNILVANFILPILIILILYIILFFKIRKGVSKFEKYLISEINKF